MEYKQKFAILVLSCDKYKYVWDDFFNLRDMFWPDCPYQWYVATESEDYDRKGIEVIKCGKNLNWTGRFKFAAQTISAEYLGVYLEDFFIEQRIDTSTINSIIEMMEEKQVSMINVGDVFKWFINQGKKEYLVKNMIIIPKHLRYGLSAETTIWNTSFLLDILGDKDCSAWDFEMNCCKMADSEEGQPGLLLCDSKQSLHPSRIPVIVQGKLYPPSIKHFKKRGYNIDVAKYNVMSFKDMWMYNFKHYLAKLPFGKKPLKWIATHLLGYKFFSDALDK